MLPERIELDEWGYPVILADVPPGLERHARRAVRACPALALRLYQADEGAALAEVLAAGSAGQCVIGDGSMFLALCAACISSRIVASTGSAGFVPRFPRAASLYMRWAARS